MSKVIPINTDSVSPAVLVRYLNEDVSEFEEIYVVAFLKDRTTAEYYSGSARGLHLAGGIMQAAALKAIEN